MCSYECIAVHVVKFCDKTLMTGIFRVMEASVLHSQWSSLHDWNDSLSSWMNGLIFRTRDKNTHTVQAGCKSGSIKALDSATRDRKSVFWWSVMCSVLCWLAYEFDVTNALRQHWLSGRVCVREQLSIKMADLSADENDVAEAFRDAIIERSSKSLTLSLLLSRSLVQHVWPYLARGLRPLGHRHYSANL